MLTLAQHASSSSNPATSQSALWAYLQPALDHIIKSPSNDPDGRAPPIDFGLYAGIHSACYNYFTQSEANSIPSNNDDDYDDPILSGTDLYVQLDKYFEEAVRELYLGAPMDDIPLIQYLVPCFNRYHAGAQASNRLLSYVNRHYVKRAIDEDRGWLRLTDIVDSVAQSLSTSDSRETISSKLREKKIEELRKWGYHDGDTSEKMAYAESCAEAASSLDRIVPISSLAYRRFRTEFMEPLLVTPKNKAKSKAKNKIPKPGLGPNPTRPKGRLARAVKELLETDAVDQEERHRLAKDLAKAMEIVGVKEDHLLRKKLEKYVLSLPTAGPSPSATT